jgi:membrane protein DedA with SNARE-associated domain
MLLSSGIAGGKWLVQVMLGLVLLNDKAFIFLKNIGFVCFTGSCILIPYILSAMTGLSNAAEFFFGSLVVSVITMIVLYYRAVRQTGLSARWWLGWLLCLAVAITLQLTVVFGYL